MKDNKQLNWNFNNDEAYLGYNSNYLDEVFFNKHGFTSKNN